MHKIKNLKNIRPIVVAFSVALLVAGGVYATDSTTTEFSQNINEGSLSLDILDDAQQTVASPGVAMSAITASTSCQDPGSTGTLGSNTERIYVDNPEAATNGWTMDIAATGGSSAEWVSGSDTMSFNDPTDGGCDTGQMSVDPSVGSTTADCANCDATGINLGSAASFESVSVDAIELVNAASESDDIWRGYFTDFEVEQVIPGEQPSGNYTLDMTLTVTSN